MNSRFFSFAGALIFLFCTARTALSQAVLTHTWQAHDKGITALVFSPDSQTLATAGEDRTLKLWDMQTGKLVCSVPDRKTRIAALAFSPDGSTLATTEAQVSENGGVKIAGEVRLWAAQTGKLLHTVPGPNYDIQGMAFWPDGSTLAIAGWHREEPKNEQDNPKGNFVIRLHNVATGELKRTVVGMRAQKFSPDGKTVAAVAYNPDYRYHLEFHDIESGRTWGTTPRKIQFQDMAFSPDGKQLISSDNEGSSVKVCDVATAQFIRQLARESSSQVLAVSPQRAAGISPLLVLAGLNRDITLWSLRGGTHLQSLFGDNHVLAISPDGRWLAGGRQP